MTRGRVGSLQRRLVVQLALVYIAAISIAIAVLVYQAYEVAESLNDRELSLRARDLARFVVVDSSGVLHLNMPAKLAAAYAAGSNEDIFAIRAPDGRIVAASPPSFAQRVAGWPRPTEEPSYFHLNDLGSASQNYDGLSIAVDSEAGPLSISVARAAGTDALVHSMLREFVTDISWIIPILVAVTLGIGVLAIRGGLKPIIEVSRIAAGIDPGTMSVRLPEERLPSEIAPLVRAMNNALDRLEQGFAVQRAFTANAAHELRTPLAIIAGALDTMQGNGELAKLKSDVARMNRLVEQLLRVARLDAVALDVSVMIDLNDIAKATVAAVAPWVVGQGRSLAFAGTDKPIHIRGNAYAIEDAIRNLVENAVVHSPVGEEVTLTVSADASLRVADHGPGIPLEDRERIFDRFWRGKGARSQGAGLGLAIVGEIVKAHRGNIAVSDNPGGGAILTMSFTLAS
jgi:signal transduction histidine kinase